MASRPVYVKLSKRPHPHYSYKQIVNEVGEISSNHRGTKRLASHAIHTLLNLSKTTINCEFIENGVSDETLKKLQNDSNNM